MSATYDEQLAVGKDEQRRGQLLEARAAVAAGVPVDARDAALRSYDTVLAELPRLLALLDDDAPRIRTRTRTAYLLAWFPEVSATTLPRPFDLAERSCAPVVTATALITAGLVSTSPPGCSTARSPNSPSQRPTPPRNRALRLAAYADPSSAQQQLVQALARLEYPWVGRQVAGRLHDRGLPDSQNALRAYAGLPPVAEGR